MHLRCRNYKDAYLIIKTACTTAAKTFYENDQLKKIPSASTCIKTWCLYADLEEQLGVFQNVKVIKIVITFLGYISKNDRFKDCYSTSYFKLLRLLRKKSLL